MDKRSENKSNKIKFEKAKNEVLGLIKENNHGSKMKVVEYNGAFDIIIEFQDEYKVKRKITSSQLKKGTVINPYDKTLHGVGYLGEGKYDCKERHEIYEEWEGMLKRCYDPYALNKFPTYIDCYVCDEWHCFQNFAKWYDENYYEIEGERMCLDKDILIKGNKTYSSETCVFVPEKINLLFSNTRAVRGENPMGVCFHKASGKFQAYCNHYNKKIHLGLYKNARSAWLMYKINKELVIQSTADEYKNLIPEKLYKAMYKWEIEIND